MLDAKFWASVGIDTVACYRRHIFDPDGGGRKAKDIFGNSYKEYSKAYSSAKKTGKLFRQASAFKDSTAPVLSSDLLRDYKLQGTSSTGFKFGFATQGGKVDHLAKLGRVISSEAKPIPDKIAKFVMKQADKYVMKKLGKIKGRTFNI